MPVNSIDVKTYTGFYHHKNKNGDKFTIKFNLKFSILSILHMVFTSIFTSILDVNVLMDIVGISKGWQLDYRLESALFSGVMCGFATAICYLVGGSSAGIDLLAAYLSSKKQLSVGKINAIVNACIIVLSIILSYCIDFCIKKVGRKRK